MNCTDKVDEHFMFVCKCVTCKYVLSVFECYTQFIHIILLVYLSFSGLKHDIQRKEFCLPFEFILILFLNSYTQEIYCKAIF